MNEQEHQEAVERITAIAAQAGPAAEVLRKQLATEASVLRDFADVVSSFRPTKDDPEAALKNAGVELAIGLARAMAGQVESSIVPLAVMAKNVREST